MKYNKFIGQSLWENAISAELLTMNKLLQLELPLWHCKATLPHLRYMIPEFVFLTLILRLTEWIEGDI